MIHAQITIEVVEAPSVRISFREAAVQPEPAPEHTSELPPLILYGAPSTTAGTTDLCLDVPGALALR